MEESGSRSWRATSFNSEDRQKSRPWRFLFGERLPFVDLLETNPLLRSIQKRLIQWSVSAKRRTINLGTTAKRCKNSTHRSGARRWRRRRQLCPRSEGPAEKDPE